MFRGRVGNTKRRSNHLGSVSGSNSPSPVARWSPTDDLLAALNGMSDNQSNQWIKPSTSSPFSYGVETDRIWADYKLFS